MFLSPTLCLRLRWCPVVMTVLLGAQEKRSKRTQDPAGSSQPSDQTKVVLRLGGNGARGRGTCGHGRGADPPLVGAARTEFIPGIGNVPVVPAAKVDLQ